MKFSRNPINGLLESYTDEGAYVGHVFTMGDFITSKKETARDGGPGSGNFGHVGRPGKVGGSGKGGGKWSGERYRGGRADIGYFGTRKDWLNGLTGEPQHKAARFIAKSKRKLDEAKSQKAKIEKLAENGLLTYPESEGMIKSKGLQNIDGMTPEEYIVSRGKKEEKGELVEHLSKARKWEKYKDQYIDENLTDDEKKVFEYVDRHFNRLDDTAKNEFFQLKAKAMGIKVDPEISEESLIGAGLKEAPPKPEETKAEEKPKTDYSWYDKKSGYSSLPGYMGTVTGKSGWGRTYSKEEVEKLNKEFLDYVKYDKLSPLKCKYAIKAVKEMRDTIGSEYDERYKYYYPAGMKVTQEMTSRLDESEKSRLLRIMNSALDDGFSTEDKFKSLEEIKDEDFTAAESALQSMSLRSSSEQQVVRDYVTLMDKMMTGESPSAENPVEAMKKAKKEEEKKKREEWVKKRDEEQKEFVDSGKAKAKQEIVKKVSEIKEDEITKMDHAGIAKVVNDSGMFREGSQFVTAQTVPASVYATATLAYKRVIEKFPFMAGEFGGFGDDYTGATAGCCVESYRLYQTEIMINNSEFVNTEEALKARKIHEERKSIVKTDDDLPAGYADFMHEIGHSLSNWLHRYTQGEFVMNSAGGFDNDVATQFKKNVFKKLGIEPTFENIREEVSSYAAATRTAKDPRQPRVKSLANEFFAECFAEYMCSSHPRRVAAEFGRQLEEFIKKNKITENSSAATPSTMPKLVR